MVKEIIFNFLNYRLMGPMTKIVDVSLKYIFSWRYSKAITNL